uniref:Methyltransferase FkbM domain-containing protein n=1 Tax=Daphnia galeata TaxID=27404 RepID=A0A8J2WGC8_9CRUS|nr:unnamed protein product [Daphnia galeata]
MMASCNFTPFRANLQLMLVFFVLVALSVVIIHQRTNSNDYETLQQLEKLPKTDYDERIVTDFPINNRKYNLIDEIDSVGFGKWKNIFKSYSSKECNLEYINENKLPQDHPCVIETIRRHYLKAPSPPDVPLNLVSDSDEDRSPGQTGVILRLLKNQTNGFFVECGALDGEFMSNTIDLERKFNWAGILIEANPITFQKLISRNRKAHTVPICLSFRAFSNSSIFFYIHVTFQPKSGDPGKSHIEGEAKTLQKPGIPGVDPGLVTIQCFPFYSVLLAVGQTRIDFFSLDVEGHELEILKTIPWHKVDIKSLTVEWDNMPEGKEALIRFMEDSGFITIGAFDFQWTRDVIFIKDAINTH